MLSEKVRKNLEKQQYRIVGNHSAVKICCWTKNMLRKEGGCYKLKFYGILSNKCMQVTTSFSCANRCIFCWRDYKAPALNRWKGGYDSPSFIIDESLKQHHKLLSGFGGNQKVKRLDYEFSKDVKHVALSLTGEPILYPKINQLIGLLNKKGISTFLVTNAQYPEKIKRLAPVTQLYLSLDAPNSFLLKKIDVPLFNDYNERLIKSLKYFSKKQQRKCIRITLIKGVNDIEPQNYAKLIKKGDPDFIEVKSYMHVGTSIQKLKFQNMPSHNDVVNFSRKLVKFLPDYKIVTDYIPSKAVLIAKKTLNKNKKWFTWIDFEKYNKLVNSGGDFTIYDYLKENSVTGLSSKKERDAFAKKIGVKKW